MILNKKVTKALGDDTIYKMRQIVILVLVLSLVLGFLFWKFGPTPATETEDITPRTLTVWGLFDSEEIFRKVAEEYKKEYPYITINYVRQNSLNYRPRVQTQINSSQGPDIFLMHSSWAPMFLKTGSLSSAPVEVISLSEFSTTFYPIARETLIFQNNIYGLPAGVDGLGLFINEEILRARGVEVPKTWVQFYDAAISTTTVNEQGQIQTAGAAMGSANNIEYWGDILGLLFMQQPLAKIDQPNTKEGAEVLYFYANFLSSDPQKKSWDPTLETASKLFAEDKLAMMLAPSSMVNTIRQANPNLKFQVTQVPQLNDKTTAWGSFWAYGVSNFSSQPLHAWRFVKFLTSAKIQKLIFEEYAGQNLYGTPYARMDMQTDLINDPYLGAFVAQGPFYKSWYLNQKTADLGVNDEMSKNFQEALEATLRGGDALGALNKTSQNIPVILDKYHKLTPSASQ